MKNLRRTTSLSRVLALILGMVGCGNSPDYQVGEVEGVLLIKGRPGHKVRVEFIPDVGVAGPSSTADTDAEGKFTLQLFERDGSSQPGAVVGMHRVVLSDQQLAESATGRGVPIRFGPEYTLVGSTPLTKEVKEGKQTIPIEVP